MGVTEDALNLGPRHEAGKPIKVVEQLENCHRQSMTGFSSEGKQEFPANYAAATAFAAEKHPLKNAMIRYCISETIRLSWHGAAFLEMQACANWILHSRWLLS